MLETYIVILDHTAEARTEVDLVAGETIQVVEKNQSGKYQDNETIFPTTKHTTHKTLRSSR